MSSQELQVGFASTDITPPIGFRMGGGYGEVISTGIHDPLLVKAMVMQQGQESFAIAITFKNPSRRSQANPFNPKWSSLSGPRPGVEDYHQFDLRERYGPRKPLEVQVVRLDRNTALVPLPHEIFVETGISIKAASPFRNTLVMSLANDIDFYIPTRRAFEEGSYEITTCPVETGCGELLV